MTRSDPLHLQILAAVAGQLQYLEHGGGEKKGGKTGGSGEGGGRIT